MSSESKGVGDVEDALRAILQKDPRYSRNAYYFAFQALEYTINEHLKLKGAERRHVDAAELLDGMRRFALENFGFMARDVWESWGVYSTADWGEIIYHLIGAELMKANQDDSIEKFRGVYSFDEALSERLA